VHLLRKKFNFYKKTFLTAFFELKTHFPIYSSQFMKSAINKLSQPVSPYLCTKACTITLKIPAENQKFQPKLTQKNKKTPFKPQKPTKPQFSPVNFPSKTVIFLNFSQKSRKSSQKVKKSVFFESHFPPKPQKKHQSNQFSHQKTENH